MEIKVQRLWKKSNYTIGKLFINGEYICNTLEDADRGLKDSMEESEIYSKKVYGETAIPTGKYNITLSVVSPKFKDRSWAKPYSGKLPRLVNVKGFEGVLIHVGNTAKDSLGCILVGHNTIKGSLTDSSKCFQKIMTKLLHAKTLGENISIEIE
jgi:hypothetical protein